MEGFRTVAKKTRAEILIKKSRFIASVCPVISEDEALKFIQEVKEEFKDATHNVYAYQVGIGRDIQRFSDDGEPGGTAGRPTLEVIKNEGVTNVVIVTTRYFGGIMLGAGGLIRAYSQAAREGLHQAGIVVKKLHQLLRVTVDYHFWGPVQHLIDNMGTRPEEVTYLDKVSLTVPVLLDQVDRFRSHLVEATNGQVVIEEDKQVFLPI